MDRAFREQTGWQTDDICFLIFIDEQGRITTFQQLSDVGVLGNPVIHHANPVSHILQIAIIGDDGVGTLLEIAFLPRPQQFIHAPHGLKIRLAEDGDDVLAAGQLIHELLDQLAVADFIVVAQQADTAGWAVLFEFGNDASPAFDTP